MQPMSSLRVDLPTLNDIASHLTGITNSPGSSAGLVDDDAITTALVDLHAGLAPARGEWLSVAALDVAVAAATSRLATASAEFAEITAGLRAAADRYSAADDRAAGRTLRAWQQSGGSVPW